MSKRLTVTVAFVALAGALAPLHPRAQLIQPKTAFDQLYKDYADGDHDVITRTLKGPRELAQLQFPADAGRMRKWLGTRWDRTRAAFILEFAAAESQFAPGAAITAVSEGRLFVTSRPRPLGESAADDAFELAWHKGAMSFLEDRLFVSTQELYLDTVQRRYAPAPGGAAIKLDPRFALHRAVAQEQRCWNDRSLMASTSAIAGLAVVSPTASGAGNVVIQGNPPFDNAQLRVTGDLPDVVSRKACLSEGVRRYAIAAASPETAIEAFTRSAWMQYQLGAFPDALKTIDRADTTEDGELTYWTQLFRGRILDGLERYADAERAYRAALAVRPAAQSAGVGLALTLFKLDRVADARAAAVSARQQPPNTVDPWWTYLGADARFLPRWRAELRLGIEQK
ncbi:MAG TPA: hypothetical protein VJN96_27645 [Vicinamibacterales bacterium]|nr:hypothetical protein [Vicinamibacterales bacterium]